MKLSIIGPAIPNIPWQPKPAGQPRRGLALRRAIRSSAGGRCRGSPASTTARWCRSAGKFIGVFRTEGMDRVPHLHVGRSPDGLKWTFEPKPIEFTCEDPEEREAPRVRLRSRA